MPGGAVDHACDSGDELTWREKFTSQSAGVLVGPGGMGTRLQTLGLPLGQPPERWNLEHPERVRAVHGEYAAAGAGWLLTNTFGANRVRLATSGLDGYLKEVNAAALREAIAASDSLPVFASIGPTGSADSRVWDHAYAEQVEALAGVNGFVVETIINLSEGLSAVRRAVAASVGPVVASYTPAESGDMLDGTSAEEAARQLFGAGATAVGLNCGWGPEAMLAPVERLVKLAAGPVYVAPNAGLPRVVEGRAHYALRPDAFARAAIQFEELGVRLVAGCCGTNADHIRAAVLALRGDLS